MDLKRDELCNCCSGITDFQVNLYVFGNAWDAEPTICESCLREALKVIDRARGFDVRVVSKRMDEEKSGG